MPRPIILRTDTEVRFTEADFARLGAVAEMVTPPDYQEETLIRAAAECDPDIISTSLFAPVTARVMAAAPRLKAVVKYGVGVDNIDVEEATRLGVMVVNCPEYGSETVADHAFSMMIGLARKTIHIDRAMRERAWMWPDLEFIGVDLFAKTIGIVGLGRIGRAMARRCGGFGMRRLACDPYVEAETFAEHGCERVGLDVLLEQSDFVSIHCVLTPETRGFIDAAALERMKETAFIVNVSRGAIIQGDVLATALAGGGIAGAGLDVFPEEPVLPDNPLLAMDNVILTPHLAWYTVEADERLSNESTDRTLEFLEGKTPRNLVNAEGLRARNG
jgi:D-3-phosphoglycerate dehydrogenase / 2-oxoglutarate reductase